MKGRIRTIVEVILRIVRSGYLSILNVFYKAGWMSEYAIPVLINNFNRYTFLLQLIEFLEKCGFKTIIILDNKSTYPPLLEYYKTSKHKVIFQDANYGHLSLWKSGLFKRYAWNYFVYTDPDILPVQECPEDFIHYFKKELDKRNWLDKIGFGIKIDDLPDTFVFKEKVVRYESGYWKNEISKGLFLAPIDTTFALYKPFSVRKRGEVYTLNALRTGNPYMIRHMPWYVDSGKRTVEDDYYLATSNSSSSIGKQGDSQNSVY